MKKFIFFIALCFPCLLYAGKISERSLTGIDPANTYVFMAGVLKWQSASLNPFSDRNRKDQELYNLLLSQGIKKENAVFLRDHEATLDNMNNKLKEVLRKTNPRSTFIFYYAGHGVRAGNDPVCFANYDYDIKRGNGFKTSIIAEQVNSLFKGNQVWLLADCCFSGSLMEEAKRLSSSGKSVISFTSSTSSNISTANWTFTQTIIDCMSGLPAGDRNSDGKITLGEVQQELLDAMKFREKQLSGAVFYNTDVSAPFNLSPVQSNTGTFKKVEYVYVQQNNLFEPARVFSYNGSTLTGELYHYSDKQVVTVPVAKTKPIAFAEYPAGKQVDVSWNGKNYPAMIREVKDGFHYIHYTGYDDSWNEWVMYDRIFTKDRKQCTIEWQGNWYPGELILQKGNKYFVHYTGYGNDWDEWVGSARIKF